MDELCRWLSENGYSQVDCAADAEAGAWTKGIANPFGKYFSGQSFLANIRPANLGEGETALANYHNAVLTDAYPFMVPLFIALKFNWLYNIRITHFLKNTTLCFCY